MRSTALRTVGALADDLGRRRLLLWGAALLTAASALGGLAPSIAGLVAARASGHGRRRGARCQSGLDRARVSRGAVTDSRHRRLGRRGRRRDRARSASGWRPRRRVGWRSSYWLEAAAALALLTVATSMSESRATTKRPIDLLGAVTRGAAMACLTAGLIEGHT